ncbi:(3S)-malyl-CoA thioesterase [Tistlia consotensis]|uniref:(3S)-malyl-CoA thioesterase n=1 Tax=Tistlia consotensis USBA 355 TaxID=560819 RepID=A0A1Y6BEQ9_9PROT|nr:thioesterase family protein [Tistlia consotensis]SME97697.1 (3S)-malyl-CoA thioesterase [Tistlia consotensis USBA 355]SNR57074.1 (3S)-malyl-CoA thioesterase [Tistlia consotensis]
MSSQGPLEVKRLKVEPGWIDYNGHMNVAFYLFAFDRGYDVFMDRIGVDQAFRERTGGTIFTGEAHVSYHAELKLDAPIALTLQVIGYDRKRLHTFMTMRHAEEDFLAATVEWMSLFVDLNTRRVAEMPDEIYAALDAIGRAHAALPRPAAVGKSIAMPAPKR